MVRTQIYLTDRERKALRAIARDRGITQSEVIREAVDRYLAGSEVGDWKTHFRRARGMWKDRTDLPGFGELRREWDRPLARRR